MKLIHNLRRQQREIIFAQTFYFQNYYANRSIIGRVRLRLEFLYPIQHGRSCCKQYNKSCVSVYIIVWGWFRNLNNIATSDHELNCVHPRKLGYSPLSVGTTFYSKSCHTKYFIISATNPKSLADVADCSSKPEVDTETSSSSIAAAAQKYESEHSPPKKNLAEVRVMTGEEDERIVIQVEILRSPYLYYMVFHGYSSVMGTVSHINSQHLWHSKFTSFCGFAAFFMQSYSCLWAWYRNMKVVGILTVYLQLVFQGKIVADYGQCSSRVATGYERNTFKLRFNQSRWSL